MGDYTYTSALFESMKVAQIIPRLKEHLARGRKVVVFHRRIESKEPLKRPFETILNVSEAYWTDQYMQHNSDKTKAKNMLLSIKELRKRYADLLAWEQGLDLRMPREQLADAFGKDDVLFFSGKESKKAKDKAVEDFNSDTSEKNIMVIQEDSGKEGISLHDTTGVHQRVLVTLALPQSPITALQIEGRIYRIGNKSNAIFEYPLLGLNAEMMLFGQKFNQQVSTTENLALGSQARNLRESFARGVEEHSGDVDIDGQGVGGKEMDAPSVTETDAFDRAVLDYYTNQKLTGRRDSREGQDYYPTPEPLGYMMNQWGRIGEGESVLEPSAGHGSIARYVPRENVLTAVEPSHRLFSKLQLKAGGNGRKFENDVFENYNVVNKHDVVLMNPPFGVGGRMAVDHVAKAFQHLDEGGRVVAIIPRGSTDKKFEKWYEGQKDAVLTAEIGLPDITFERAGTSVNCRVVVIDKVTNKDLRGDAASRAVHVDLSGQRFDKIEDFFEEIRDIRVPERTIDYKARLKKKAAPVARELRGMKGIKNVDLNEDRIFVNGRGVWASLQWGDWQGDALTSHLANEYARFRKLEEYAADRGNDLQIDVYGELKELCCKLAGLTEDEMQRYILKKESGKDGDLYREDDWDNKKTPFTDQPNRANEKPVSGSVPASIHRDSSSIAMASKQADAKIDNDTQSARTKIKKYRNGDFFVDINTLDKALSDVGKILSMRTKGGSRYSILRTKGGNTVAIRLSDHLANGNNFKRDNANSNLSIVIERHIYNTKGESDIEYTEAVIKEATFNSSPEKVINAIVNGVNDVLEDKEFTLDSSIGEVSVEGPSKIEDKNLYREADLEAVNERFNEQLGRYERGELSSSDHLSLGYPMSPITRYFMPNKEIIVLQKVLTKGRKKHHLSAFEMRNLPKSMSEPIFVFKSGPNKLGMLLGIMADNGKNIFVAIDLGITKQLGHEFLEINDITSIHDRDVENIVLPIVENKESLKYVDKKKGLNWLSSAKTNSQAITKKVLSRATNIVKEFENPSIGDENLQRGGDGAYTDEELSYENDPLAKWMGESGRSEKQKRAYAEKARERMVNRVNELADLLHLDNVEVVTDASTLEGEKARAKGWFSPKTGKIVVVIPNHKSIADVEQTVLHEAVAHYGLRKLFGKHFDDFLWNVYNNASEDVRRKIADLAAKRGWDFPKATEEYLASLAEDTDFENAVNSGWFSKIKFFFMKMLAKAGVDLGVELGDNELRYILWRSYENMAEPGRYRGVIEQAADVAKQYELGVGNYANGSSGQQHVAEDLFRDGDPKGTSSGTDEDGASDGRAMTEDDVEMYLNALHGPERNQLMAERDAEAKAIDANGGYMKEPVCG